MVMSDEQIASLTLKINSEAMRSIISSGRLLEFADTVAAQAAAQISSQVVQHVAEGALRKEGLESGVSADVDYVFVVGDGEPGFGTVPRPPRWVVTSLEDAQPGGLRQMAESAGDAG
jgi:hypothetical protein